MATKRRNADSAALRQSALKKKRGDLLVVTGLGAPKFKILEGRELDKLGVDERYQRVRIGSEINHLVHILSAGGDIPDPIKVAKRPDGSMWIVDGQQRYWAHVDAKKPLKAVIYDVADLETEQRMFVALNTSVQVKAEYIIKASGGETAGLLRTVNEDEGHPLYGKLLFRPGSDPFNVSVLARGLSALLTGSFHTKAIQKSLAVTDQALRQREQKIRAEAYLRMVGEVRENGKRQSLMEALAFGSVCRKRWHNCEPVIPNGSVMGALRRANYDGMVDGHALKYLPVIVAAIESRWPEKE